MSGYLQRLAGRAVNPRGPIHPVVGSFFSPPPFESTEEVPAAELETPAEPPRRVSWAPKAPVAAPARPELPRRGEEPPFAMPTRLESARRPEEPPFAAEEDGRETAEPLALTPRQPLGAMQERPREAAFQPLATPPQPAAAAPPASTPTPGAPMVAGRRPNAGRVRSAVPAAQAAPGPLQQPAPDAPAERLRGAPAARRDPDQIQIHIGRIEVTAAPPAPVAPPPRPAPKSLNLAEYLKRGDRRAQ